jgi:serine protease SohB
MEFLAQYGLFLLKTLTILTATLILMAGIFSMSRKPKPKLEIIALNKRYDETKQKMQKEILGIKAHKKKKTKSVKPVLYVIDFKGDLKATQADQLRDEITAILTIAKTNDEVLVRIESPGGTVNGYGLAASQLQRLRMKEIPITVCIDKIAASGGYLMACVANQIIAAPFSIIGSIGVVAQVPNFHRLLQKNHIDVELLTAGEYKRTLTMFGENTDKARLKFKEDLEKIHQNFRDYVLGFRQHLDMEQVATGEHWLGKEALELALIDKLQTSDEYIQQKMEQFNVFQVAYHGKISMAAKLMKPMMKLMHPWA